MAQCFPAEIISADSRQVYRYMDIGTAKPGAEERAGVPHHVINVVDPDQEFTLAMYHRLALDARRSIERQGKLPLLVGGSGLYVWSLVEGWKIPEVPPDQELRRHLEERAEREGSQLLYRELQAIDPEAAARIDPHNTRRIIRALEISHATGQIPSRLQQKEPPDFPVLIIGLTQERGELYKRIDSRVDDMIQRGLITETEQLLKRGYAPKLPSMSGIGYRQMVEFLLGEMTLSEAVDKMKYETHRMARRQYAWFRPRDRRIRWFDIGDANDRASAVVLAKVKELIGGFVS